MTLRTCWKALAEFYAILQARGDSFHVTLVSVSLLCYRVASVCGNGRRPPRYGASGTERVGLDVADLSEVQMAFRDYRSEVHCRAR